MAWFTPAELPNNKYYIFRSNDFGKFWSMIPNINDNFQYTSIESAIHSTCMQMVQNLKEGQP